MRKRNSIFSIVFVIAWMCSMLTAGNAFARSDYTEGSGMLLKDKNGNPSVPASLWGTDGLINRLNTNMDQILEKFRTAGAAVALIYENEKGDAQTLKMGFGYAKVNPDNPANNVLVNPETTVFQVASVSKLVSAWGVIHLVDEGLVDLDVPIDPVEKVHHWPFGWWWEPTLGGYLQSWHFTNTTTNRDSEWINEVTLRRIIHHRAGLTRNDYLGWKQNPDLMALDPYKGMPTLVQCLNGCLKIFFPIGLCTRVKVIQEPDTRDHASWDRWYNEDGKKWAYNHLLKRYLYGAKAEENEEEIRYRYSNGGYTVLQQVIEDITGQDFADYMQQEVLGPLGMEDSSYLYSMDFDPDPPIYDKLHLATPYSGNMYECPHYLYTAKAMGGLYTTVGDYAEFVIKIMEEAPNDEEQWQCEKIKGPKKYCLITKSDGTYRDKGFCREDKLDADDPDVDSYLESIGYIGDGENPDIIKKKDFFWHSGLQRGWSSVVVFLPEEKVGLVVLTNTGSSNYYTGQGVCAEISDAWMALYINLYGEEE
ncbi:MAG: beta-lactamase family protein [Deltaproteobacteria bacterium]|nr:beta-lactamase family protein [Deltaproteobacteria bacterium]